MHENVGVIVENDMVALRTLLTGTHGGVYGGVPATGKPVDTSISHFLRPRGDRIVEHWMVIDTYSLLARIGAIPGVGAVFQQMVGAPQAPAFGKSVSVHRSTRPRGLTPGRRRLAPLCRGHMTAS